MFSICKSVFKTAVVGTAVLGALAGGALLLAGPARTRAVIHEVKSRVSDVIDDNMSDPVQLRNKLRALEREYPERIAAVRADLAELNAQIRQLDRERAISERVVELATDDLAQLRPQLEQVEQAEQAVTGAGGVRAGRVVVAFGDHVWPLQRAAAKVRQIENTRSAHASRAVDAEHSMTYLRQQAQRFEEVLDQLEAEQAEFQVQLFQLNRQVDSIQRNERLIKILGERKRTLEECTSYDITSLDQITGKLDRILTRQSAELDVLSSMRGPVSYEDLARDQLADEERAQDEVEGLELDASQVTVPLQRVGR